MTRKMFIKRTASIVASSVLLFSVIGVSAGNRLIKSEGQYAINSEEGNMLLDTDDIEANAEAIAGLKGQLGGLSFKYGTEKDVGVSDNDGKGYYWSQTPEGEWVKIGAVGNAVPTDVLTGKKFSSESGVDIEGTMPNPTSASISAVTNPSTNLTAGGSTVTINNNTDTTDDHSSNASQINLGIGEQITIPHGYYNKDIVISNGVSNRGALSKNNSSPGYYSTVDTKSFTSTVLKTATYTAYGSYAPGYNTSGSWTVSGYPAYFVTCMIFNGSGYSSDNQQMYNSFSLSASNGATVKRISGVAQFQDDKGGWAVTYMVVPTSASAATTIYASAYRIAMITGVSY